MFNITNHATINEHCQASPLLDFYAITIHNEKKVTHNRNEGNSVNKSNKNTVYRIISTMYFVVWLGIYLIIPAQAYIDPATTAMVTQIVAGIFISAGVLFGVFRRKIILFFKNISIKRTQRKIEKNMKKK